MSRARPRRSSIAGLRTSKDRLPDLAGELTRRRVAVIAAIDTAAAIAAKAATTTVPVVFASGGDPVREGLVASLSRPGGNVTGVTFLTSETGTKLLGLLLELLPGAMRIAALVDLNGRSPSPSSPTSAPPPRPSGSRSMSSPRAPAATSMRSLQDLRKNQSMP